MNDAVKTAIEAVAKQLTSLLYADAKYAVLSKFKQLETPLKKLSAPVFSSPQILGQALKNGSIIENQWVTVECKPSLFGTFLGNHYVPPMIGSHTSLRLGPSISSNNPAMAMMGQFTSHLKPVGLFPQISSGYHQICLYPSDADAFGFMGILPDINNLVPLWPAICRSSHLPFCNMPCNVTGVVRQVSPSMFESLGVPLETWESFRQRNEIWFLDLSDDKAEVRPLGNAVTLETWGALYASGHIEIKEGVLPLAPLIEGMKTAFSDNGFDPHVMQNKARAKEFMIFARGLRAIIGSQSPIFTIHMDAELALDYEKNKSTFDKVVNKFLEAISYAANANSVQISNTYDLDFSYTDSASAFTILESVGANMITDPVGLAIRDWHRKRTS